MSRLLFLTKLLLTILGAVARQAYRRLAHGPLVASWPWYVELRMVAVRTLLVATAHGSDRSTRRTLG